MRLRISKFSFMDFSIYWMDSSYLGRTTRLNHGITPLTHRFRGSVTTEFFFFFENLLLWPYTKNLTNISMLILITALLDRDYHLHFADEKTKKLSKLPKAYRASTVLRSFWELCHSSNPYVSTSHNYWHEYGLRILEFNLFTWGLQLLLVIENGSALTLFNGFYEPPAKKISLLGRTKRYKDSFPLWSRWHLQLKGFLRLPGSGQHQDKKLAPERSEGN